MAKVKLSNGKEIEVREPKVRDMRIVSTFTNEVETEVNLIANLTGLTIEELDEFSLGDYKLLQTEMMGFLS